MYGKVQMFLIKCQIDDFQKKNIIEMVRDLEHLGCFGNIFGPEVVVDIVFDFIWDFYP